MIVKHHPAELKSVGFICKIITLQGESTLDVGDFPRTLCDHGAGLQDIDVKEIR